jgi:ubiquinone/menaquinone biosynthesis C-methylase UbiE
MTDKVSNKTIADFGKQWTNYTENTGYYASVKVLDDLFGPLMDKESISGKKIADVGAGTGRFVKMFHELGAKHILALEPSSAIEVLKENTRHLENVEYLQTTADRLPVDNFNLVFCIGVLQFIPEPVRALKAMGRALSPNGRLFLWVYGQENNRTYLSLVRPLRLVTARFEHVVVASCRLILFSLSLY